MQLDMMTQTGVLVLGSLKRNSMCWLEQCWEMVAGTQNLLPCLYNLPHLDLGEEPHQMFRKPFSSFFIKHSNVLWSNANACVCSKRVLLVFKGCYILYDDTSGHKSHSQWCRVEDKTL